MGKKTIVSTGSTLLDMTYECTAILSELSEGQKHLLENKIHGKKLKLKSPAIYAAKENSVEVDFSNAEDAEVAGLGKIAFGVKNAEAAKTAGGGAYNTSAGIKRLNAGNPELGCKILAKIGGKNGKPDKNGEILLNRLADSGIETDLIRFDDEANTGCSLVLSFEFGGKRNITYLIYRGAAETLSSKDLAALEGGDIIGGVVANANNPWITWKAIKKLSGKNRLVVYISSKIDMTEMREELNAGNAQFLKGFENVIATVNESEFDELQSDDNKQKVVESFAHFVVTKGADGGMHYSGDFNSPAHYGIAPDRPVFEVPKSQINPNGAGDAFSASLASQYIAQNGECIRFDDLTIDIASCVAACVCTRPSTTGGIPIFKSPDDGKKFGDEWRDQANAFDFLKWGIN